MISCRIQKFIFNNLDLFVIKLTYLLAHSFNEELMIYLISIVVGFLAFYTEEKNYKLSDLSRDESSMGRFLKEQGTMDKTPAGKLMCAMGKAQCMNSQQR